MAWLSFLASMATHKYFPGSVQVLPTLSGFKINPDAWHCGHCGLTPHDPCTLWVTGSTLFDGRYVPVLTKPSSLPEIQSPAQAGATLSERPKMCWVRDSTDKPLYICRDDKSWVIANSMNTNQRDTLILAQIVGSSSPADVAWPQGVVVSRNKPGAQTWWWDRLWSMLSLSRDATPQGTPCVHCGLCKTDVRQPVWVSLASPYMQYSGKYSPCDNFAWARDFQEDDNMRDPMLASMKLVCDKKTWTWHLVNKDKMLMSSQPDAKHPVDAAWLEPGIVVSHKAPWF